MKIRSGRSTSPRPVLALAWSVLTAIVGGLNSAACKFTDGVVLPSISSCARVAFRRQALVTMRLSISPVNVAERTPLAFAVGIITRFRSLASQTSRGNHLDFVQVIVPAKDTKGATGALRPIQYVTFSASFKQDSVCSAMPAVTASVPRTAPMCHPVDRFDFVVDRQRIASGLRRLVAFDTGEAVGPCLRLLMIAPAPASVSTS